MYIKKYNITLIRLREEHLETVRQGRNSAMVNQYMEYQQEISPEQQLRWFQSINNENNSYYVIEYDGKQIGLINEKNIDFDNKTAEAGLFIWDHDYINTPIPLFASLCLLEIGFVIAGGEKCFIKIHNQNKNAIDYNKKMGFEYLKPEGDQFGWYVLNKEGFEGKVKKIIKAALTLSGDDSLGSVTIEKFDFDHGIGHLTERLIKESGLSFIKTVNEDEVTYSYDWRL